MSSTHPKPWIAENTLPLVARKGLDNGLWTIKDGNGKPFCAMFDEHTALEIVAAVNSHADLLAACEASAAWHWAEREAPKTTTFDERMELCRYSEWLTLRALLKADGKTPSDEPYAGLLCVWTGHRTEAGEVSEVVQRILNEYRAAISKERGHQ